MFLNRIHCPGYCPCAVTGDILTEAEHDCTECPHTPVAFDPRCLLLPTTDLGPHWLPCFFFRFSPLVGADEFSPRSLRISRSIPPFHIVSALGYI